MTSPHRLKFVLLLICCMQHALASTSLVHDTSTPVTPSSSVSTVSNASAKAVVNNTASKDGTSTTGTSMTATKKASATATVEPTSTTHDTTKSSSADVKTTSPSVTTLSSMSTIRNASFSIGTKYSSPDCTSCSIGGTITVTMSCSINNDTKCDKDEFNKTSCGYVTMVDKMYSCADVKKNFTYYEKKYLKPVKQCDDVCPATGTASFSIGTEYSSPDCTSCSIGGTITVTMSCSIKVLSNDDKKCDKDEFNKISCGYVVLANEKYRCADVKKNFTYYEKKHLKPVKQCGDVCPTSGSVLSAHLVFIFSSGLAVGLLSQTL